MTQAGAERRDAAERLGEPDQARLRAHLEQLERIHRPSASEGERVAAEWLVARLAEAGAEARIEEEEANGTFWWPVGIGAALGALGGLAALRGRRATGFLLGATGAAAIANDFPPHGRSMTLPAGSPCTS